MLDKKQKLWNNKSTLKTWENNKNGEKFGEDNGSKEKYSGRK